MNNPLIRYTKAFSQSIRERGFLATFHIAISTLWCILLDNFDEWVYRTNTSGDVPLESLAIKSANKAYAQPFSSPSQYRLIRKALKKVIKVRDCGFSRSTLVDFGCGKGRVLIVGSEFGFKKVVGVEFSPELCREAEANISAYTARKKKPCEFQIVNADVTCFEIPPNADVFFFFAFYEYLLDRVVRNILRSRERYPRSISAIYVKATYGEIFENHGFRNVGYVTWCGFPTKIYQL